ncbi:unnamed protein product [Caenorhabditis sp. 36 PRJEB53466]|nr:unnamed protein product [Caenorhabditis sp. 36 PRJEB53466]
MWYDSCANLPSRDTFEFVRLFDIERFRNWNKERLGGDLVEKRNACTAYLIDMFGCRPGYPPVGEYEETGMCDLKVENIRVQNGNRLDLNFVGIHNVPTTLLAKEIDEDFGKVFEKLIEIAVEHGRYQGTDPDKQTVFNQWNVFYDYLFSFNRSLTPRTFRLFHASRIVEQSLQKSEDRVVRGDNVLGRRILNEAVEKAAGFLNHRTIEYTRIMYVDPRIIAVWLKKHGLPMDMLEKPFKWAVDEIEAAQKPFKFEKIEEQ